MAARRSKRAHPAAELADRERLRDVVVGAELEPEHLVQLVVAGGQHDDRHAARRPQALADLEPVQLRQHQVEHDEVEALLREPRQRLLAVARLDDAEAVALERIGEELLNRVLVVDEQDGGGVWHRSACLRTGPAPYYSHGMAALPPRSSRRRPRRGSLERPVSGRLYRGTWLLVGIPLLAAAFSVHKPGAAAGAARRCRPPSTARAPRRSPRSCRGSTRTARREAPAQPGPPSGFATS